MVSYSPDQAEEYTKALEYYGFVVIKVLNDHQCDIAVEDMLKDINTQAA
jgi:hypothetical protein